MTFVVAATGIARPGEEYADRDANEAYLDPAHFGEHGLGDAVPRLETRERVFLEPFGPTA